MAHIGPRLAKEMKSHPVHSLALIVRVSGEMSVVEEHLVASGVTINRRLALIKGFAITATVEQIVQLNDQPWVLSIELDAPVGAPPA
jgi:hypothetical protein